MKIGLALGGGVARGFFHVGVIKGLEEIKVKIDIVSGTSIGAVIGGIYALQPDAKALEERVFNLIQKY